MSGVEKNIRHILKKGKQQTNLCNTTAYRFTKIISLFVLDSNISITGAVRICNRNRHSGNPHAMLRVVAHLLLNRMVEYDYMTPHFASGL